MDNIRTVAKRSGPVLGVLGLNNQIVAVRMGAGPPPEAPFTQTEPTTGVLDALTAP